ncbi:N-acetylated-alpha-linked acidic dipeptidase 2-like isoform X2 [Procambarus clarkii]|uniref:N-acetylated-alpha-linked acidic dipeptidase 2-like isoform X2 n=1 Tax=Procambarus clarkii TaxID=6728 RepID=UPI003741EC50
MCRIPPLKSKGATGTLRENSINIRGLRLFNTLPLHIRGITGRPTQCSRENWISTYKGYLINQAVIHTLGCEQLRQTAWLTSPETKKPGRRPNRRDAKPRKHFKMVSHNIVVAAATAVLGLLIGGLIGYFGIDAFTGGNKMISMMDEMVAKCVTDQQVDQRLAVKFLDNVKMMDKLVGDKWDSEPQLNHRIIQLVNTTNLRDNLKELSRRPHLAGTERDDQLANMIRDRFLKEGFDTADLVPYDVLLSRPNHTNPNLITLTDGAGKVVFTSAYTDTPIHEDDDDAEFVHAFNAYTPAGDMESEAGRGVVYANYARVEDFDTLEKLNVNVSDCIVIARYGKIFRGNKLLHAQERGAKGLILFSDPEDVAQEGVEPEKVYPNTWWLPGTGMERGTQNLMGDLLTPGWPSTAHAYRLKTEDAKLPKIPCQPIGYNDARVLLEKIGGAPAPGAWKGGLMGVAYNLGPELLDQYRSYRLRLNTHNSLQVRRSYNVIATIRGDVEPDRYVLLGNHRDAWGYGAADPSSGTSQMLETARVLGQLITEGWRPRRTLVFCSWGAEEYGLIGSTEWVEEHVNKLQERAVMYLNTDICASGPIIEVPGSPLLWDPITKITKMVPGVRNGATVYEEWVAFYAVRNRTSPKMETLGSGSDYGPFSFYCGIPCLDLWFRGDKNKYNISTYPSYHTGYETFYMMDKNMDPGFRIHQGCSRIAALTLRYFADSALLPYSLEHLPKAMKDALDALRKGGKRDKLISIYDKYSLLEESVMNFTDATAVFARYLKEKRTEDLDPITTRAINDLMMKLEQVFILPAGLPGRPQIRHAVFAPSQFDSYAASGFPGITDLLYNMETLTDTERQEREEQIKRHVSDLTIMMQRATSFLKDFHVI